METRTRAIIEGTGHRKRFYAEPGHPPRNPHMKGVTSTLRLWFGKGLGSDYAGEQIRLADGTPISVFEACSLPNFLMCSSTEPGRKSRPTKVMKDNCTGHARNVVRILEPTLIVCHGTEVGARVAEAIKTLPKAPPVSSDAKCNTPRRFDIGKVVQDLKECCHAILFASVGGRKRPDWRFAGRGNTGAGAAGPPFSG
jgi:hypothetical protein